MSEYGYRVIYEHLAEGGFQVIVPALPGIVTYGRTIDEAHEMAKDAIACRVFVPQTRPIRESINRGNVNPRPSGAKPTATAKPEGRPASGSSNGNQQSPSSGQASGQNS